MSSLESASDSECGTVCLSECGRWTVSDILAPTLPCTLIDRSVANQNFDCDQVPLRPDGNCRFMFDEASKKPNLVARYSEWQWRVTNTRYRSLPSDPLPIKITNKVCTGNIVCSNLGCAYSRRPKQNNPDNFERTCRVCSSDMVRLVCPATCMWVEAKFSDRAIIIHSDRHSHAVPHVLKPDFYCKKMLTDRICNNPMAKAVTLVTGTPIIGSVCEIHESYGNLSRVAYFRRQVLRDLGVRLPGSGDSFIDQILEFQLTFGKTAVISSDFNINRMHLTVASSFMLERFVDVDPLTGRDGQGAVSDVTYSFFDRGFLMTTAVYCGLLARWVPVAFSWLNGLTREHYRAHFEAIFSCASASIQSAEASLSVQDKVTRFKRLCGAVMDFSNAQTLGFIDAYISITNRIFNSHGIVPIVSELKADAQSLMKGCRVHFICSAQRIDRNHAIVGRDNDGKFLQLIMEAVEEPMLHAFHEAMKILHDRYPKARPWFSWWLKESVACLIFESQRKLDPEVGENVREDSNPIESMHLCQLAV
uniref:GCM domain-containing protein n=1 Tax=Spongospora subterranea TaxID=70186 RepID=A0A0H5QWQ4_9EUKA|eukprot:CRZ06177.1 hypothetical protein [Spongospora subterranea]